MQRKPLNDLKGRILKTHPKRQNAPSAFFFSKSGTKPHRNLEGPQNGPHARKRLISLGSSSRYIPRRPGKSRFRGPPLFLLHSVSGQALWAKKVSDQPSRLEQSRDISQDRVHVNHRGHHAQKFTDTQRCNAAYPPDLYPPVQGPIGCGRPAAWRIHCSAGPAPWLTSGTTAQ